MRWALVTILLSLPLCAHALALNPWLGDDMVLQRDQAVTINGTALPNERVNLQLGKQTRTVQADGRGHWSAAFDAQPAQTRPTTLEVRADKKLLTISNILFGDVWLCAGQSNMEFPLAREAYARTEVPQATQPLVRLRNHTFAGQYRFAAPLDATTVAKLTTQDFYQGRWETCRPETAEQMSAVGYYFAQRLARTTGVPVGLVNFAIGGAPIEAFISRAALAADPLFQKKVTGNWLRNESIEGSFVRLRGQQHLGQVADAPGDDCGPNHGFKPGFAWAAGPARVTPFALTGVLWYQGESNAIRPEDIAEYGALMRLLVADWRQAWRQPNLPFYWVQLPSIDEPARQWWPEFREVQRQLVSQIPHTGMAVALDLGVAYDVHPREKRTLGERLAGLALCDIYGQKNFVANGPSARAAQRINGGILIRFDAAEGLGVNENTSPLFEVRRAGEVAFQPAVNWQITDQELIILAPGKLVEIRYAWHRNARASLRNGSGLPASPWILKVTE